MFRASVHTSFIGDNLLRLGREDLDGACHNESYPDDFFIDLIFTDARNQSNMILGSNSKSIRVDKKKQNKFNSSGYPPEEEYKQELICDVVEEEKRLMAGIKNLENKDDFWITISQQLTNRSEPIITPQQNPYLIDEDTKHDSKAIIEVLNTEGRKSLTNNPMLLYKSPRGKMSSIGAFNYGSDSIDFNLVSPGASSNMEDPIERLDSNSKQPFEIVDIGEDGTSMGSGGGGSSTNQNYALLSKLTIEEKEKIQKMIETAEEGSINDDEIDDELDNYLDNLENESD